MNVGGQIKKARKAADMTQAELAERLEVSLVTVQRYEGGQREASYVMLQRIATYTDKPLGFFFEDGEAA